MIQDKFFSTILAFLVGFGEFAQLVFSRFLVYLIILSWLDEKNQGDPPNN
jgi:hypothetical protein